MKSTAYGKWFPRRIRPQNGHGNSVATLFVQRRFDIKEGRPRSDARTVSPSFNPLSAGFYRRSRTRTRNTLTTLRDPYLETVAVSCRPLVPQPSTDRGPRRSSIADLRS
jgi:hypothetical protein